MKNRLVVLSDYGLDDAVATLYLLKHKDKFSHIDLVAVGGNVTRFKSLKNIVKLTANCSSDLKNVRIVDTNEVTQFETDLPSIHGVDGMGDLLKETQPVLPVIRYADWIKENHSDMILVSLGPATLALEILKCKKVSEFILMAGVVEEKPNFKNYEFNQALDLGAYDECLKYPHVIATLDTCRATAFNLAEVKLEGESLIKRMMQKCQELAVARHPDNCYIYDYIAVRYLVRKDDFEVERVQDTRGNSLCQLKIKAGDVHFLKESMDA